MTKRIITISREFGSGGHTIGKKQLPSGWAFHDSQLISKVAKQSGLSEEFIRDNEEYASHANSFLYQIAMSAAGSYGYPSIYQKLYEAQTHVIEELAERKPASLWGAVRTTSCADAPTACTFSFTQTTHTAPSTCWNGTARPKSRLNSGSRKWITGAAITTASTLTAIGAYATTTTSRWTADCSGRKNVEG